MSKGLTAANLEKFRNIFEQRRAILLESRPTSNDFHDEGGDEVDAVQSHILSDMAEKLSQRDRLALVRINEALRRIELGTFGVCFDCEEPIGEKRLLAVPDCSSCISCAEKQEKEAKQYGRFV